MLRFKKRWYVVVTLRDYHEDVEIRYVSGKFFFRMNAQNHGMKIDDLRVSLLLNHSYLLPISWESVPNYHDTWDVGIIPDSRKKMYSLL